MILLLTILVSGFMQAQQDTVSGDAEQNSPENVQSVTDGSEDEEEELTLVDPWPDPEIPGYYPAETDSTIRWFLARDWTERIGREPGTLFYRTGSIGRPNGIDIYSYENRHQELELYELTANDPVTGRVNWLRLPMGKLRGIHTADWRMSYHAEAQLQDHYLTQPRTYLNFYESKENYRTLEFAISQNIVPELNLELSFRDRKDGTRYPSNDYNGTQTAFRGRYHLNERYVLKTGFFFNNANQDQPFGYIIEDMKSFDFNPFNAVPVRNSAVSSQRMNDMFIQLFRRSSDDGASESMLGISRRSDEWLMTSSDDTVHYAVNRIGLNARHDIALAGGRIRLEGSTDYLSDAEQLSLTKQNWIHASGEMTLDQPVTPWLTVNAAAGYSVRNDGKNGHELSGRVAFEPFDALSLSAHSGTQSMIPDIQSMYWQSDDWSGNPELLNETGTLSGVAAVISAGPYLSAGVRIDRRIVEKGIFAGTDSLFMNIDDYKNETYTAWFGLNTPVIESEWSVSRHNFQTNSELDINRNLAESGEKIWVKGSFYWKNYLFNRATFVKAGLSGRYSPGGYSGATYLGFLNRWQHGSGSEKIPSFYSVDMDVSARIRWMMVLVRWENLLDQVTQPGYFETAGYPMPGRRFIFGIRVLFTN